MALTVGVGEKTQTTSILYYVVDLLPRYFPNTKFNYKIFRPKSFGALSNAYFVVVFNSWSRINQWTLSKLSR